MSASASASASAASAASERGAAVAAPSAVAGEAANNPMGAVGFEFAPLTQSYGERDVSLYALGVGAAQDGALGEEGDGGPELKYVYENADGFAPLPTFAVTFPFAVMGQLAEAPGLVFNPMLLLHGEQYVELRCPGALPAQCAEVESTGKIADIFDKGKGALVNIDAISRDKGTGAELCYNRFSIFLRGAGGFGGDAGPPADKGLLPPAGRENSPAASVACVTDKSQALLYRWSGDSNPLHADPGFAAAGGFDKPIIHGLCSLGFAARAVLNTFGGHDQGRMRAVKVRFTRHVFPGETIITDMWQAPAGTKTNVPGTERIIFRATVKERPDDGPACIGYCEILPADAPAAKM